MERYLLANKFGDLKDLLCSYTGNNKISKHDLKRLGGLSSHCSHLVLKGVEPFFIIYNLYKESIVLKFFFLIFFFL